MVEWLAYTINNVWIKNTIPDDWPKGLNLPFFNNKINKWPSGLEHWTGDRVILGSNPAAATSPRDFGNSVYPALPVSFGGDLKAVGPFYLVSMPGEVKDHTSLL